MVIYQIWMCLRKNERWRFFSQKMMTSNTTRCFVVNKAAIWRRLSCFIIPLLIVHICMLMSIGCLMKMLVQFYSIYSINVGVVMLIALVLAQISAGGDDQRSYRRCHDNCGSREGHLYIKPEHQVSMYHIQHLLQRFLPKVYVSETHLFYVDILSSTFSDQGAISSRIYNFCTDSGHFLPLELSSQ